MPATPQELLNQANALYFELQKTLRLQNTLNELIKNDEIAQEDAEAVQLSIDSANQTLSELQLSIKDLETEVGVNDRFVIADLTAALDQVVSDTLTFRGSLPKPK